MSKLTLLIAVGLLTGIAQGQPTAPSPASATSPSVIPDAWKQAAPPDARWTQDGWFAPPKRTSPAKARPEAVSKAFIIPIDRDISTLSYRLMAYKVETAVSQGAEMIIFEMDTPGGYTDVMEAMAKTINGLEDVYTVAWVHPKAYSAGAVISLACNTIVMSEDAVIGDAMPILLGFGGVQALPDAERSKAESPMRAMIRSMAEARGQNPDLWEAMVHTKLVIQLMRNENTGEVRIVEANEWERRQKADPEPDWKFLRTVDDDRQLVTLKTPAAVGLGLAEARIADRDALNTYFHIDPPAETMADRTLDKVAVFLLNGWITFLLIVCFGTGLYLELNAPGLSIFGAVAALALIALVGSRFLIGLANPVEIGLLALGIILIVLEIFVIPGFGVAGVSGIALVIISLLAMAIPNAPGEFPWPKTDLDWNWLTTSAMVLMLGFVGTMLCIAVAAKFLPKSSLLRRSRLILQAPTVAPEDPNVENSPYSRVQVGDTGTAASNLRPVGEVRFGPDVLAAIADGQFIDRGTSVRVVRHDGNRLVVEPDSVNPVKTPESPGGSA